MAEKTHTYEWQPTRHGRKLVRVPIGKAAPAPAPVEEPTPEPVAGPEGLEYMTKAELVAEAENRGVDATGTKAEVLARLLYE